MKKIILITALILAIISCASKNYFSDSLPNVKKGSQYEIADFSVALSGENIVIKNISMEHTARFQFWLTFLDGDKVLGTYSNVGNTLSSGMSMSYPINIPQGTDRIKTEYREYAMDLPSSDSPGTKNDGVPQAGAFYFLLTDK